MNILIIQDNADATANLREILTSNGHSVIAASTVQEAVERSDGSQVGAVLVTGCTPDTDGLREVTSHAPLIVITGHTDCPTAFAALRDRTMTGTLQPINPVALRGDLIHLLGLRAAEQKVEQAARLAGIGELAASVAHELNNALATVTLRLEGLLAKTTETDPRRHALEVVDQEIERMAALVSNLLEFARCRRGGASTVDICDEVTRTAELTHHHLTRKGVRVVPEFAAGVPHIQADRQQLRQVFLNLFTNAADAMPDGGRLSVRVRLGELPDARPGIVIEVADTGTGIPPEILPRLTEPFFTTKEEGRGTGLGLTICKRIVDQHGGALMIESQVGIGTTIRITLPVRPSEPAIVSRGE
jgi:signal transduction histidine kinase